MTNTRLQRLKWIIGIIRECMDANFYGSITINMQDGQISHAKKEETLKPE